MDALQATVAAACLTLSASAAPVSGSADLSARDVEAPGCIIVKNHESMLTLTPQPSSVVF